MRLTPVGMYLSSPAVKPTSGRLIEYRIRMQSTESEYRIRIQNTESEYRIQNTLSSDVIKSCRPVSKRLQTAASAAP